MKLVITLDEMSEIVRRAMNLADTIIIEVANPNDKLDLARKLVEELDRELPDIRDNKILRIKRLREKWPEYVGLADAKYMIEHWARVKWLLLAYGFPKTISSNRFYYEHGSYEILI
jgi:ribosomal protein L7/L12